MTFHRRFLALPAFALLALGGCANTANELERVTADRISRPAFMVDRVIEGGAYPLHVRERMNERGTSANVYIEGDGFSGENNRANALTLTPDNPVALHLASRDLSRNLVYIAQPCQYVSPDADPFAEDAVCAPGNWTNENYSVEALEAFDAALNDIKRRYDITGFNLIGYDEGANIAALLAATRSDVLSLRSVAGDLNPALTPGGPVPAQSGLAAVDVAPALAPMPQYHFIGGLDDIVQPEVYHSYRQAMGFSECTEYKLVPDADHTLGWVQAWPELLAMTPSCPQALAPVELPPMPEMSVPYDPVRYVK